jgi:hypothetical protein
MTSSLDVWCWGIVQSVATSPYPFAYEDATHNAVSGLRLPLAGSWGALGYVDPSGRVTVGGSPLTNQPPCTNLLQ